ncbi:MAG: hypothetical protein K2Y31_01850 [Burkholderiales bacterium]|jgi:antitoxin component YwqK of YwqJK toxin-antitoxin module|nr:hypothetical protein [Burkholderiales bacterium]
MPKIKSDMHVTHLIFALILSGGCSSTFASGIKCPKGTKPNGEQTPEVSEAWCEKRSNGRVVQHGPYRAWWPNNRLGTSGQYINGIPAGKWSGWHQNGKQQGYEWFENGKVIKGQYWDAAGNKLDAKPTPP